MSDDTGPTLAARLRAFLVRVWRVLLSRGPSEVQFWFIALAIGIAAGAAAVAFRLASPGCNLWSMAPTT